MTLQSQAQILGAVKQLIDQFGLVLKDGDVTKKDQCIMAEVTLFCYWKILGLCYPQLAESLNQDVGQALVNIRRTLQENESK